MTPYNPASICPKCGCRSATSRWMPKIRNSTAELLRLASEVANGDATCIADEHIERKCAECGFRWAEAPKDAKP